MILSAPVPELSVPDLNAARTYFVEKLGFTEVWLRKDDRMAGLAQGDFSLFIREGEPVATTLWVFAEDVDATHAALAARGAKLSGRPENKPWGLRQFTIECPGGHQMHVHHDL